MGVSALGREGLSACRCVGVPACRRVGVSACRQVGVSGYGVSACGLSANCCVLSACYCVGVQHVACQRVGVSACGLSACGLSACGLSASCVCDLLCRRFGVWRVVFSACCCVGVPHAACPRITVCRAFSQFSSSASDGPQKAKWVLSNIKPPSLVLFLYPFAICITTPCLKTVGRG